MSARIVSLLASGTEIVDALVDAVFDKAKLEPRLLAIRRATQRAVADRLMAVAADTGLRASLRAEIERALVNVADRLDDDEPAGAALIADIARFLEQDVAARSILSAPALPPGSPIGCGH